MLHKLSYTIAGLLVYVVGIPLLLLAVGFMLVTMIYIFLDISGAVF